MEGDVPRLPIYLACAALLVLAAVVIFRVLARRDYLRYRRLSFVSSILQSIFWAPVFAFPYLYNPPSWPVFWRVDEDISLCLQVTGSALILLGFVGVVLVMAYLGFRRSFGQDVDLLQVSGPYALSRNPQIVAGFPIFLGIALRWPSWYAVGWVGLAAACLHLMVITEEEHLSNVFGAQYAGYCGRVPRYIGFPFRRDRSHAS
jgi:protein-S-isoprenylcysteine O-methyltransferase Ste14